ncbi:hypothetical protein WICPIJ_008804 [Wickerhamomyces pijperi]|uniref:Symplekin/Pta1 N-terminal domain-containing protein n=1 Tax=Wickerhamomyces pijperi TaxID=599730 RepID=A0A9P8PVF1_WICPI|nr:hypothetical protein WICPIJ_008804 [Wickerhamomyces pijperi]
MSAQDTISTLEQTKAHIIQNPQDLLKVATTINNIASSLEDLAVQQWCAHFYHELFASSSSSDQSLIRIPSYLKQQAAKVVFPSMLKLSKVSDVTVYRNVILAFACVYELVFDLVAKTSDGFLWEQATALKDQIIANWSTTYPLKPSDDKDNDRFRSIGSRIAAAKFIGKVIVVQSSITEPSSDPRATAPSFNGSSSKSGNPNEISVSNIPDGHHILSKSKLMAESEGLMDLLLKFFQEEDLLVSQMFIAVLNTLVLVIQRRRYMSPRVFQVIANLDYNTKYQGPEDDLLTYKLHKRFIARAIKNALNYCVRAGLITTSSPFNEKFSRLVQTIDGRMNEQKKRGILINGPLDKANKKPKIEPVAGVDTNVIVKGGSASLEDTEYKTFYQLIDDSNELAAIDVSIIPHQTLVKLTNIALTKIDTMEFIKALTMVSQRYTEITIKTNQGLDAGAEEVKIDEQQKLQDDEDNAHILDGGEDENGTGETFNEEDGVDSGLQSSFVLPTPSKFSLDETQKQLSLIISNFFQFAKESENEDLVNSFNYGNKSSSTNNAATGEADIENSSINDGRLAISKWKKTSWLILLTRLATRGLNNKTERAGAGGEETQPLPSEEFSDLIREAIFNYCMENILERIDLVIDWLNEEWYAEYVKNSKLQEGQTNNDALSVATPTYFKWAEKLLDSTIPFIESSSPSSKRNFVRLLSDLPHLNRNIVFKLKSLCIDPLRNALGMQSLTFLLMFRPPVKQDCVALLRELMEENEELKEKAQKLLDKYGV